MCQCSVHLHSQIDASLVYLNIILYQSTLEEFEEHIALRIYTGKHNKSAVRIYYYKSAVRLYYCKNVYVSDGNPRF